MALLYTKMKVFHYREKLASLSPDIAKHSAPLQIRIKPTNACNHNCYYCAYRVEGQDLGQDMNLNDSIPREKMMELLDDCISMGVKAITFSGGGEPFCYKYMKDSVEKLAQSPIKFAALTNGSLLSGEIAELFSHNGTWIRISMDGWDDRSYVEYRGCRFGEFSNIISNMEQFKKIGGPCYLGVNIVVDQKNCDYLYGLISHLKDIGVDSVKTSPCIVSNSGIKNNQYHSGIYSKVKEIIQKAKADFEKPGFELFDSYHGQLETFEKQYDWCPYIQLVPVIGADLNLYSCHDKAYSRSGIIDNLNDKSLQDAWFSDQKKFFRIKPCRDCNHHCVSNEKNQLILEYLQADSNHLDFV